MYQATNTPYRKQYNSDGTPIEVGTIRNDGSNRRSRRDSAREPRAFNNSRNVQQIVTPRHRWLKKKQHNIDENGKPKVINHLIYKS